MFKKIKIIKKYLFDPMPLNNNFSDYNDYWKKRNYKDPALSRAKIISKKIKPNSSILDIGCGEGGVMDYIFHHNNPKRIVGIDISTESIKIVKKKKYEGYVMDIFSEDFEKFISKNKLDYIIITEVLEHIQDPEILLNIIRNNFDGIIFVSIPNSGFIMHRFRLLFGKFPVVYINLHIKEHIRFWTHADFLFWSKHLGFVVMDYFVNHKATLLGLDVSKLCPSLFGKQLIYIIKKRKFIKK